VPCPPDVPNKEYFCDESKWDVHLDKEVAMQEEVVEFGSIEWLLVVLFIVGILAAMFIWWRR